MSRSTLNNYNNSNSHLSIRNNHQQSSSSQISRPPSRPPSEQLCDLHVYKVPSELWRETFNNILNNVVTETVSVGIIRVPGDLRLVDIREEIVQQLQLDELVPYVFLRSVGRSLTRLKTKQEYQLKAKHFIPPVAYAPELYILETTQEIREAIASSERSSQSPPLSRRTSPTHRNYALFRNGDPDDAHISPAHKYQPLPKISPDKKRAASPDPNPYNSDDSSYKYHDPYIHPFHHTAQQDQEKNAATEWDDMPAHTRKQGAVHLSRARNSSPYKHGKALDQDDDSDTAHISKDDNRKYRRENNENRRRPAQSDSLEDETEGRLDDQDKWTSDQDLHFDQKNMRREKEEKRRMVEEREEEAEEERQKELQRKKYEEARSQEEMLERMKREENERKKEDKRKREEDERKREEDKRKREEDERKREEDKRKREEEERKREEDKRKREEDKRKRELEEEEGRKHREEADRTRKEEEKLREEEEKRKNEEEKRRKEENRRKQEDDERKQKEADLKLDERENKMEQKKDLTPSSPPVRDTESAKQKRRNEKNQLLKDIEDARVSRQEQEREREELVKKAKQLQHKTTNRRNEARDMWKKKYFEEKKKTAPLEENSNRLHQELEALHRKLMNTLEGPKDKNPKIIDAQPSPKNNYVIQCTKLQHEIEDLQRRVENARMKLTAEMKLRNQAQGELRALRAELSERKLNLDKSRQEQLATFNTSYNIQPEFKDNFFRTSLESF